MSRRSQRLQSVAISLQCTEQNAWRVLTARMTRNGSFHASYGICDEGRLNCHGEPRARSLAEVASEMFKGLGFPCHLLYMWT